MNTYRGTAIIVGALFITATVASVLGFLVILSPILDAPDYLTKVSENKTRVIVGVLIDAINSAAVVAIPVLLYPIFKKHSEGLALGYLASRIIESVILIVGSISLLSLLTVSQEFIKAGTEDASHFQALGTSILALGDLAQVLGATFVFALTALFLNYLLFQSRLVPRFISVWGLIGVPLMLTAGLLGIFGFNPFSTLSTVLFFPLALNEMVLAIWLIVKGFNPTAIASLSAKTQMSV